MAMLAAPRRKQKFSVDPTGSSWSKDESKFGQKMLEKMGWAKGRGLGANEDGRTDHVKITLKDDNRGVGCSKSQADNWIAHQDDFNSLLANLNQNYNDDSGDNETKVLSLEKKSKSSRGRVHYQKFTKGKDLSSRKLEDLDCIFGRRKKKSPKKEQESSEKGDEAGACTSQPVGFGVETFDSSDSIQGYFAKKMSKQRSDNSADMTDVAEEQPDVTMQVTTITQEDESGSPGLGLKTFSSSQSVQDYFAQKMAMLKRGRKTAETNGTVQMDESGPPVLQSEPGISADAEEQGNGQSKPAKKKKQKKRKRETCELDVSEFETATDADRELVAKKKNKTRKKEHCGETVEEPFCDGKQETSELAVNDSERATDADREPVAKKKNKTKKKEHCGETVEEPFCESLSEDSIVKGKKKRKKDKKKKKKENEEKSMVEDCVDTDITGSGSVDVLKPETRDLDIPSRKRVRFREPITSVLGPEIDADTDSPGGKSGVNNIQWKPSEIQTTNKKPALVSVEEHTKAAESTEHKKRKKSKKKDRERKTSGGVTCDISTSGELANGDLHTAGESNLQDPNVKNASSPAEPNYKKWMKVNKKHQAELQNGEVKDKRRKHILNYGEPANIETFFPGSNLKQIKGYSNHLVAVNS